MSNGLAKKLIVTLERILELASRRVGPFNVAELVLLAALAASNLRLYYLLAD